MGIWNLLSSQSNLCETNKFSIIRRFSHFPVTEMKYAMPEVYTGSVSVHGLLGARWKHDSRVALWRRRYSNHAAWKERKMGGLQTRILFQASPVGTHLQ